MISAVAITAAASMPMSTTTPVAILCGAAVSAQASGISSRYFGAGGTAHSSGPKKKVAAAQDELQALVAATQVMPGHPQQH